MDFTLTEIFLTLLIGVVAIVLIKHLLYLKKLPPGPWGLPIVGSMLHLNKVNHFIEFEKYRKQYGPVFSMTVGSFNVIVINGHKLIRNAFKQDVFNGRPDFDGWKMRNLGKKNRGILFSDGNHSWNEQRRFTLKQLRDFGFGKDSMEGLLLNELDNLILHLKKYVNQPLNMKMIFNASVLNSLWVLISGRRFELDDETFQSIISLLTENLQHAALIKPQLFFTWPARFGLVPVSDIRKLFIKQRDEIIKVLEADINKHRETYQENVERDFIDVYLKQINDTNDPESSFYGEEGKDNLIIVLQDLFVAGAETTSTTLLWSILHLATNQKIQQKIFNEIENKIGVKIHPTRDDKPNLVYVEAFLNEVHRHCSLVPFSIHHKVFADTTFEGHFIPEGTVVLGNLYEAHHNKDFWGDPQNFRPERFLNSNETELIRHEALIPFSTGKRVCLGEALARDTLFLFLTGLIQNFTFELDSSSQNCYDPTETPEKAILILSPKPYKVIIKTRN